MKSIVISEKRLLVKNLVLIDGISRAGKFFLGRIVDGFERVEHFLVVDFVEIIPYLERVGAVRRDAAISLLQFAVDAAVYDQRIGRNLNLRYADGSSIFKCPSMDLYFKRCFGKDGAQIISDIKKENRISVFVTHEVLPNIPIFFQAFPMLKVIEIVRHPVDLIYSWYQRGLGEREIKDPISLSPFLKVQDRLVPWFASTWSKEYSRLSRIDRIIKSIVCLYKIGSKAFGSLPPQHRRQIHFVRYEEVIEKSWEVMAVMGRFLGTEPSASMPFILNRESCLRAFSEEKRDKKMRKIKKIASKKMFNEMIRSISEYEQMPVTPLQSKLPI